MNISDFLGNITYVPETYDILKTLNKKLIENNHEIWLFLVLDSFK
jgi:hypothetical protein